MNEYSDNAYTNIKARKNIGIARPITNKRLKSG
jgi:hypothetical protein